MKIGSNIILTILIIITFYSLFIQTGNIFLNSTKNQLMLQISWLEWVGYLASVIIMASMLMSSIIRLRWINMTGAAIFCFYGFMIGAPPVGLLNGFIVLINIYHLVKIYRRKEYFTMLEITTGDSFFLNFLNYYDREIKKLVPSFQLDEKSTCLSLFVLRNMSLAGVFLAREISKDTLQVDLDFVIPEYRDFKLGHYILNDNRDFFLSRGYRRLVTYSESGEHTRYLKKMKFTSIEENGKTRFVKDL